MAFVGRMRSVSKLLRSQALSNADRSVAQRALLAPTFTHSEFSRNYASATAKEVKVKIPLALYGGSGRYATALYLAAVKANVLDKVESELLDFVEASKRSPTFSHFAQDPTVSKDVRIKAVQDICTHAKFGDITNNFLALLAEYGRLRYVERVVQRFVELTMEHKGIVKATVTTVIPLPAEEEKELKETLQYIIGQGKKVTLEQKIDTNILGGIVVEFSQKVFDMSIRTRARQMERFLRDPVNIGNL